MEMPNCVVYSSLEFRREVSFGDRNKRAAGILIMVKVMLLCEITKEMNETGEEQRSEMKHLDIQYQEAGKKMIKIVHFKC